MGPHPKPAPLKWFNTNTYRAEASQGYPLVAVGSTSNLAIETECDHFPQENPTHIHTYIYIDIIAHNCYHAGHTLIFPIAGVKLSSI